MCELQTHCPCHNYSVVGNLFIFGLNKNIMLLKYKDINDQDVVYSDQ